MFLAQIDDQTKSAVTTIGGLLAFTLVLLIKDYVQNRKTNRGEATKINELSTQSDLLRELVAVHRKGSRTSRKLHKRTRKLLGTVIENQTKPNEKGIT